MKRFIGKINSSISLLSEFGSFVVAILRKPIFLLFLFLVGIALVARFINIRFSLPLVCYLGLAFVGFVWSAFQVYRDLLSAYQNISSILSEKIPKSELSVSCVEGNEYTYSISDPYSGQNQYITKMQKTKGVKSHFDGRGIFWINDKVYYVMSTGALEINIRLGNSGDLPLDVSAIRSENNVDLRYLEIISDDVFLNGNKLRFPFHLKGGESVVLQLKFQISLTKDSKNDAFAADFRSLPKIILHEISFDTLDVYGKKQTDISKIGTPSRPLIDLYVKQWQEYDQQEYLLFAGYSLVDKPKDSDLD